MTKRDRARHSPGPIVGEASTVDTPVLVVGGSLTGLSAAVFLGLHGVPAVVADRRPGIMPHPRLRGLLPRAVELYRQAGLEEAITAVSPGGDPDDTVTITAETLGAEHTPLTDTRPPAAELSPCAFLPVAQNDLEALLLDRARELGARVEYDTEVADVVQDSEGIRARVGGTTLRARYAIAADGVGGGLRTALGVGSSGPGTLFRMATTTVRADLSPALRGRRVDMAYLRRPALGTTMGPIGPDEWFFATARPVDEPLGEPADWVRAATGLSDLDVDVLEPVSTFPIGGRLADRFRCGDVFLAGDAAHLMPPQGSLGGLTAIADAHNLAWRLAAALHGLGGVEVLDGYAAERRPVAEQVLAEAVARARGAWGFPDPGGPAPPRIDLDTLSFGLRSGGEPVPPAELNGQPGTRAPHVWIDGPGRVSTLDLYGTELVLLVGVDGEPWAAAMERAAGALPLAVYELEGTLAAAHGIGREGALLVRVDGQVAWRSAGPLPDPDAALANALAGLGYASAPRQASGAT